MPTQPFEKKALLHRDWSPSSERSISQATTMHSGSNRSIFSRFYSDSSDDTNLPKPNNRKYAFYDLDGEPPA